MHQRNEALRHHRHIAKVVALAYPAAKNHVVTSSHQVIHQAFSKPLIGVDLYVLAVFRTETAKQAGQVIRLNGVDDAKVEAPRRRARLFVRDIHRLVYQVERL